MSVLICPGIHDPGLTKGLLADLESQIPSDSKWHIPGNVLVFPPSDCYSPLSVFHILQFLQAKQGSPLFAPAVVFIGFSAGVVGSIGTAWSWQMLGGKVKAVIAVDGWGVPLFGNFPIHRISHDFFTHWTSSLDHCEDNFYAEPAIEHLALWRSPKTATGWWVTSNKGTPKPQTRLTAAEFLTMLLKRYGETE